MFAAKGGVERVVAVVLGHQINLLFHYATFELLLREITLTEGCMLLLRLLLRRLVKLLLLLNLGCVNGVCKRRLFRQVGRAVNVCPYVPTFCPEFLLGALMLALFYGLQRWLDCFAYITQLTSLVFFV